MGGTTLPYNFDPDAAGLIPEGTHQLTVASIEDATSSKGDPMWIIRLEDDQRREITEWVVQTPRIIDWKFKPLWEAAGLTWPTQAMIIDEQELVDKQVYATIVHERSDQFGTSARIHGYIQPGEATDVPADQTAFDVGDTPQPVGARRYGQPDDDLPF